jgi:hypothetical protein
LVKVFRYLGSLRFTLLLLILFVVSVALGTAIESKTGSHKAASRWIYSNPLFLMILWGVFANIFLSALKRYPFQKRHIPFLLTHLGLLMVFGGTLLKLSFGQQGSLTLKEGTAKNHFDLDDTVALSVKLKDDLGWRQKPLERDILGRLKKHLYFDSFSAHLRGWAPHGEETLSAWIKKGRLHLLGLPLIPLNTPFTWGEYTLLAAEDPEEIKKSLKSLPALLFLKGEDEITLLEVNREGEIRSETFDPKKLPRLWAYDEGYGGYTVPFSYANGEVETPLTRTLTPLPLPSKAEEERALAAFEIKRGDMSEGVSLALGSPLPTSALKGEALLKLEAEKHPLPQPVRLRSATTRFHPNTSQPESYEAKLLYGNTPLTLSMNRVWESPEGYRFYLANMSPLDESGVKEVRLVISRDPFKSYLTYPGAIILALGIILLFFRPKALS